MGEPRHYLTEALAILDGQTMMLPERGHLEALRAEWDRTRANLKHANDMLDSWIFCPECGEQRCEHCRACVGCKMDHARCGEPPSQGVPV